MTLDNFKPLARNGDTQLVNMYATKRRRRTVKPVKAPAADPLEPPPKSNPSKRHRERLNSELDNIATLLPFDKTVLTRLDKLSVLRLAASFFRAKSFFRASLHERYALSSSHHGHPMAQHHHLYAEPQFVDTESVLQAVNGFMFIVTCDEMEIFFATRTIEHYIGFHQSDSLHIPVIEVIHSEDRQEFKNQLNWRAQIPPEHQDMTLHQVIAEHPHYLNRCFTVRFRCILDNASGFVTLEVSGKIKILKGQNLKGDVVEPILAFFATCCPFGPVYMYDMPPREYTFKTKHKMDMAPISMDPRGKVLFGYSDDELLERGGYDLIHPDDLNYYAAAHQELIKTGSSGLIAYRLLTKDFRWVWLQTSSKVTYKNSKPDYIMNTHRHLTEDEGNELFGKRGTEFKLPYPIVDPDPSGFGAALEEEDMSKLKPNNKKKSKTQLKDYLQAGRKRKTPYREVYNGLNGYTTSPYNNINGYPGYGVSDMKSDYLSPYSANPNLTLETAADLYRNGGYPSFTTPGVYPGADSLRLDMDRQAAYTNGYYLDTVTRPYQHTLQYPSNGYSDLISHSKYPYDVSKYTYDSFVGGYGLDLSKRTNYYDTAKYDPAYRTYDSSVDKMPRINSYDSIRKSSLYDNNPLLNTSSIICGDNSSLNSSTQQCSVNAPDLASRGVTHPVAATSLYAKDTVNDYQATNCVQNNLPSNTEECKQTLPQYTSVIRSTSPTQRNKSSPAVSASPHYPSNTNTLQATTQQHHMLNCANDSWSACGAKVTTTGHAENSSTSLQLPITSGVSDTTSTVSDPSPTTTASVSTTHDHDRENNNCRSVAVPVVHSSAWSHHPSHAAAYDWHLPASGDYVGKACGDSYSRTAIDRTKPVMLKDGDNPADNPLLSYSQMTHTLMSTG